MSITLSGIPIAWYCPRRHETRLSVAWGTLDESSEGLLGPTGGVWSSAGGLDVRPGGSVVVATMVKGLTLLRGCDGPERGRLAGQEAAPKFFARPLERSACFDAILGKSSPKSNRFALGRGWSARPIFSLFMATRIFFLLKAENWKFAEPNKHSDWSRIYFMSSLDTSWSEHKSSSK